MKASREVIWALLKALGFYSWLFFSARACGHNRRPAFQWLSLPRSISSQGLGEEGVASRNPVDAMEYNPANLTAADGIDLSFFRNPWNILDFPFPISSLCAAAKLGDAGYAGFEYTDQDFGEITFTTPDNPDGPSQQYHLYMQSFSGGYALQLNDELAVGGGIRYAREPAYPRAAIAHFLFSAGVDYKPSIFLGRVNLGFSLLNFGTAISSGSFTDTVNGQPVTYNYTAEPPSQLKLGIEGSAISNDFFEVDLMAGASKPIARMSGGTNNSAESSFEALFNDWSSFPNDVTGQLGLGYVWRPIYLGKGISYFQEMYVGYFSTGPKDLYESFYTHGINVGIEANGIKATVGYAGRWNNNNAGSYLIWDLPWETFQFTLSVDPDVLKGHKEELHSQDSPSDIIISGGYSFDLPIGRMNREIAFSDPQDPFTLSDLYSNYSEFSLEGDLYISPKTAIISSFTYSRINRSISYQYMNYSASLFAMRMETFSFASGFRYHPVESVQPLFVQGSIGIDRFNPFANTSPEYFYQTFTELSVGGMFHLPSPGLAIVPTVGLRTIFMDAFGPSYRLAGYNQIGIGLRFGFEM